MIQDLASRYAYARRYYIEQCRKLSKEAPSDLECWQANYTQALYWALQLKLLDNLELIHYTLSSYEIKQH